MGGTPGALSDPPSPLRLIHTREITQKRKKSNKHTLTLLLALTSDSALVARTLLGEDARAVTQHLQLIRRLVNGSLAPAAITTPVQAAVSNR